MGGHPYWYLVPYEKSVTSALDKLRKREFAAGRYNPVIPFLEFDEPAFSAQRPGAQHASIDAAIDDAAEDGTRSILDIAHVSKRADYGTATPVSTTRLRALYGTDRPTREMVAGHEFFDDIDRGKCVYVVVYAGGKPSEILFAGYSYD